MGGCKNENEAMFMSFLARLPVDVLILCPNLNVKCCLTDNLLYERNFMESDSITKYPESSSPVRIGTVAYHAERELDSLMYQDSGMYRNQQYGKANVISLQTMYEEIIPEAVDILLAEILHNLPTGNTIKLNYKLIIRETTSEVKHDKL